MHNPESILENKTHKMLWEFKTDTLILARRADLVILNKKKITCWIVDFAVSSDHRGKIKENEEREK